MTYKVGDKIPTGNAWLPNGGVITQGFGTWEYIPQFHINAPHEGIDIAGTRGDPITSAEHAKVLGVGWDDLGGGNFIKLGLDNGNTIDLFHLKDILVKTGQDVNPGDLLGHMDSTGNSTGDHLHFQLNQGDNPIDPFGLLTEAKKLISGTGGSLNPLDALKNVNDFFGFFTKPQNLWKGLFVTIGGGMIVMGIFIYFFKEEKTVVVNVAKEGSEVAATAA